MAVQPAHRSSASVLSRVAGKVVPVALLGAALFGAGQVVTADQRAVFGSSEQRVQLADVDGTYDVGVAFGSVTVVVPDGVRARVTGTMVFGSSECDDACSRTEGQELEVNGTGAFGSIEVVTESEQREDAQEDQD